MSAALLPAAFVALFGVICDALSTEWADFRGVVLLQNLASSVGNERLKSGDTFVHPRQAVTWNNRIYNFVSYTSLPSMPASQCRERVPSDFLLFVHKRMKEVTWSCPSSQVCCGLQCCNTKQRSKREWWHYERADGRKEFGYVIVVVVVAVIVTLCLCSTANYDPRKRILKERRERLTKRRQLHTHNKAVHAHQTQVQIEQVQLLDPPLPLSTDVVHEHFEPRQNTDFRNVNDFNKSFFRGGARYIRPISCYRYALAVAGKYPGGDEWLGNVNAEGEWHVAYHGTKCENVSGIIANGFDIEKCQRFTYGKGIYCSPDPRVARGYSTAYQAGDSWYKAVIQVRVHPTIKRIAFNDGQEEYWVIPVQQAIRPYGVCVYDITR